MLRSASSWWRCRSHAARARTARARRRRSRPSPRRRRRSRNRRSKRRSLLVEFAFAETKATYGQKNEPTERDTIEVKYDLTTASVAIDLVWPTKQERLIRAEATFECPAVEIP